MGVEGNGERCVPGAADEEFGAVVQAEHLKLNRMDECMKQGSLRQFLIENDDIDEGYRGHVSELGQVRETQRFRFTVKRQIRNAVAIEFDHSDVIEQGRGEVGP